MKTKAISSFFVLFAIAAGVVAMTPAVFADHPIVTIETTEGSGFGQDCVATGCYTPGTATVGVGGTVILSNTDASPHTFTSGTVDGFAQSPDGVFDSGVLMQGESIEWSPETAGEYPYYCSLHVWMVGTIIVEDEVDEAAAQVAADEAAAQVAADEAAAQVAADEVMVEISTGTADAGEMLSVDVTFTTISGDGVEHINYDIKATQNGEVVLDDVGVHDHDGIVEHTTAPLPEATSDDAPVNIEVIFNGYGLPDAEVFTGPIGQVAVKQVVPEFGTIAMMILAVAIISIVAVTAKSRVIPRF